MSRRTLAVLAVGWLLGIVTALVTPTLVYQRQSFHVRDDGWYDAIERGWYVIRQDRDTYTLERPRIRIP